MKDVIISALACGGKMSCKKEAAKFKNPPTVININSGTGVSTGGGTVQGFRKAASVYKKNGNGSVVDGIIKTQKNLEPKRIALVSYLDGWSLIHEILKTDDWKRIDSIIVLEGINTRSLDCWERYAAYNQRLFLAYTDRAHKTASCQNSAKKLLANYNTSHHVDRDEIPDYMFPKLEKSISIYSKVETTKTKIYHNDPLESITVGHSPNPGHFIACLKYSGKQTQDQAYIQQYVQPRLWRWLGSLWNDDDEY